MNAMANTFRQLGSTRRSMSRQTGGTFLGFVLGLIVALSIAVVVALYITRSPTPFVSKNGAASDTSASAAIDNAQFDPNRILQGKSPSQPVAAPAGTPAQTAAAPAPAASAANPTAGLFKEPQIVEVPAAPATTPAPAANATDNAQNVHALNTAPPAAAPGTAAADNDTAYYLQVGAYTNSQAAQQQRARLALQGFEASVSERASGTTTYFRVRIGPFSKFDDMNSARQQLSDAGIHADVMRLTKQQ
jgi:cell division protein FtsN